MATGMNVDELLSENVKNKKHSTAVYNAERSISPAPAIESGNHGYTHELVDRNILIHTAVIQIVLELLEPDLG
jgi:hypothetical protein